jgi:hypothetical protein
MKFNSSDMKSLFYVTVETFRDNRQQSICAMTDGIVQLPFLTYVTVGQLCVATGKMADCQSVKLCHLLTTFTVEIFNFGTTTVSNLTLHSPRLETFLFG